jgi:hypothetical protein
MFSGQINFDNRIKYRQFSNGHGEVGSPDSQAMPRGVRLGLSQQSWLVSDGGLIASRPASLHAEGRPKSCNGPVDPLAVFSLTSPAIVLGKKPERAN